MGSDAGLGKKIACELTLRGTLAAGREKEVELATMSPEFDYLHRKNRCEMLISRDDTSNGVIILGTCFSLFVYIRASADWRTSDSSVDGGPQGNWRRNSNSRNVVARSPFFSRPAARAPRSASLLVG